MQQLEEDGVEQTNPARRRRNYVQYLILSP
jgi:hypothetical protein